MRDLQKMEQEARALFEGSRKNDRYDLSISETRDIITKYNEDARQIGPADAFYELIVRTYYLGMSSGMRFYKNRKGAKA